MSRTGAVDELFEEFEEDTPEEVMALDDDETGAGEPDAGVFEEFLTVPERAESAAEENESVPDLDVDALFGK